MFDIQQQSCSNVSGLRVIQKIWKKFVVVYDEEVWSMDEWVGIVNGEAE